MGCRPWKGLWLSPRVLSVVRAMASDRREPFIGKSRAFHKGRWALNKFGQEPLI